MESLKFKACKFLDFSDSYNAEKNGISSDGETKVCWNRPTIDESYPSLVQFCQKRGRLNNPESCLSCAKKQCNDYEESEHEVFNITN